VLVHIDRKRALPQGASHYKKDISLKARARNVCKTWLPLDFLRDNWNSFDYSWNDVRYYIRFSNP